MITPNIELFAKIDRRLTEEEGLLEMTSWEQDGEATSCGTTRCVAGWAIYETTGFPLWQIGDEDTTTATRQLAHRLGFASSFDFESIGRELLGLTNVEAGRLFYRDNETAREAVRLYARGKVAAARELLYLNAEGYR